MNSYLNRSLVELALSFFIIFFYYGNGFRYCIIFPGYLCKQVLKRYHACDTCQDAVRKKLNPSYRVAKLVEIKSNGGLIYPNLHFFNLIRFIEQCFVKHASYKNVFDLTVNDVLENFNFNFPCTQHAADILAYTIVYYVRLRMRQNAYQENMKAPKKFVKQKKLSKLSNQ